MEFNNSVNTALGLCQDVDFLCGTTTASYPLADKVRNINQAYCDVTRLIWESQDSWQFDDDNKTSMATASTTLVEGQSEYSIPTTAQKIRRVEVKDANGDWVHLSPLDYKDIGGVALPEYLETDGLPQYYDLNGNFMVLYPAPAATETTLASGMKCYIDRNPTLFTTASTTTEPGFATQFHRILSLGAAIDFEKDVNQRQLFIMEKNVLVEGLKRFYGSRSIEKRAEITPSNRRQHRQYE